MKTKYLVVGTTGQIRDRKFAETSNEEEANELLRQVRNLRSGNAKIEKVLTAS